ncbi:MAG: NAD(P)-dependent oxidoreductase [Lachnospiraceae bacterium]|nr:NAD(P)-dependent oxidoreductase [Lachnospiraceae bacterium]
MKKAIITGPTGSIGIALINKLISENVEVVAVCRPGSARISRIPESDKVQIVECSLDEITNLIDMIDGGADVFYHFAWDGTFGNMRNDMRLQNNNVKYALDAVEVAKKLGCRKFIGAGSQAEYGRVTGVLRPDTPAFPENGYGIAKLCAGQMTRIMCEQLGIEHVWTRILSIYGPYDGENTMIMSVISKLLKGEKPSLTPGGQMWDYLYSKDVANAFYLLGGKGKSGSVYCIGSGEARPLKEYVEILRDTIDEKLELGFGDVPYGDKQVMHLCADISNLTEDTGFRPEVGFEDGIRETIEWVRNNGWK